MRIFNVCTACVLGAVFFALVFVGSVDEISEIDALTAVYVDSDGEKLNVLCEILEPLEESKTQSKTKIVKGTGFTLKEAFEDAFEKTDKKLYTDTVQLFVVSESVYKENKMREYFISQSVNMRAAIVYSKNDVFSLADNEQPKGDIYLKKIQDYCYKNKTPVPEILEYLKNEPPIMLNENGSPERRNED